MPKQVLRKAEAVLFTAELADFWNKFRSLLSVAGDIAKQRGATYDTTPLHLRWTPAGFIHEVHKKALRIEGVVNKEGWHLKEESMAVVLREVPDIINYAAYLGALTMQLMEDLRGTAIEDGDLDPELKEVLDIAWSGMETK